MKWHGRTTRLISISRKLAKVFFVKTQLIRNKLSNFTDFFKNFLLQNTEIRENRNRKEYRLSGTLCSGLIWALTWHFFNLKSWHMYPKFSLWEPFLKPKYTTIFCGKSSCWVIQTFFASKVVSFVRLTWFLT